MKLAFPLLTLLLWPVVTSLRAADGPPATILSPDKQHAVKMIEKMLPGADPDTGFFTIAVTNGNRTLSKFPTEGFLLDAFWSPDGKFVAVNNRRANSGDYVWIFSLKDGHAVKMPFDQGPKGPSGDLHDLAVTKIVKRIATKMPKKSWGDYTKTTSVAIKWDTRNHLIIKEVIGFSNLKDSYVTILDTYTVDEKFLTLIDESMEVTPFPKAK